ncbi:baseplate assembly protein [Brucella anthropi]|uniref:baseplate assembly protein n=1 Tax=Brucella anthropi TaxID=529 RepID=UPI00244A53D5|nr:baseplate J/gp47 family protein [Brucella anthropi]MDG9791984.1 baseplate J/gp47 family protein [Brucella anthropi]MDH0583429.1 baseplate J/gp47 family protein [Brucella anthropi]MDH0818202.1 baseplate J/gp47 family protein [Brucella anthropi]MDH2085420.1 baseplate J/gp47 family protein [Brucella anthropi]
MSRFVAPNLADLGDVPSVVAVDFEEIKSSRDEYLIAALERFGVAYDVEKLETDPMVIAFSEGGGYQEMKFRQRVNEAIRALSLATAIGGDLDHIAATYAGISRLVYDNAADDQPFNSQWDDVLGKWVELDDIFRSRILLAFEAFSTAGPEGAYTFHALELDGTRDIADVAVYSEEDAAVYTDGLHADAFSMGWIPAPFTGRNTGDPVLAPEILIVVLPVIGYGAADQALMDRTFTAVTPKDVRPIGDNVRIEPATVTPYNIEVTLYYAPGVDVSAMAAEAKRRLTGYAQSRRRIGLAVQREVIGGRAAVDDNVTVEVTSPASDIEPGSKGVGQVGTIIVNTVQTQGSWQ